MLSIAEAELAKPISIHKGCPIEWVGHETGWGLQKGCTMLDFDI